MSIYDILADASFHYFYPEKQTYENLIKYYEQIARGTAMFFLFLVKNPDLCKLDIPDGIVSISHGHHVINSPSGVLIEPNGLYAMGLLGKCDLDLDFVAHMFFQTVNETNFRFEGLTTIPCNVKGPITKEALLAYEPTSLEQTVMDEVKEYIKPQ